MAIVLQFPNSTDTTSNIDESNLSPLQTLLYHPAYWRSVQALECQKIHDRKSIAYWIQTDFMPARQKLKDNPRLYQSMVRLLSLRFTGVNHFRH